MQQQQQQGGSQYGVTRPEMAPFLSPGAGPRTQILGIPTAPEHHPHPQQQLVAEAAAPISSRPPPTGSSRTNFDELVPSSAPGSFPDEDALAAGEEAERGGVPGNRWPRQETLALLKIRSEMDAAFRDATLKGPLWEDVSRKLAELGFTRSAKKCKEKFENVHKYYKRTKEGRAGRQDGKSYRFFTQLEALHSTTIPITTMATPITTLPAAATPATIPSPATPIVMSSSISSRPQPPPIYAPAPPPTAPPAPSAPDLITAAAAAPAPAPSVIPSSATTSTPAAAAPTATAGLSFSSDTCSSSASESDDEETEEGPASMDGRKRKRGGGPTGSRKMMVFFEGLMKQVMERQEAMQQRFLETIEKREHDRMIREEAWKRQEMARLNREHELMAQERSMAVSKDAAVISFLQKISGQSIQLPPPPVAIPAPPVPQPSPPPPQPQPPAPQQQAQHPPPQQPQHHQKPPAPPTPTPTPPPPPPPPPQQLQQEIQIHVPPQSTEVVRHQPSSSSTELVPVPEPHEILGSGGGGFEGLPSSRWPKPEVHALIKLRSDLESRYQEAGPKGPLWEEISAGMQRLGYNRSSKRCKEKWENINKYFKKVKESNKKRPEDAKTCPYFHQLDALYRKKLLGSASGSSSFGGGAFMSQPRQQEQETNPNPNPQERGDVLLSMAPPPAPQQHQETECKNGSGGVQIQSSNGGLPPSFFEEGSSGGTSMKKPEDIMKELMEQDHQNAGDMDDYSDMDDDDEDDDDEEDSKMQYKIQFQRQNVGGAGNSSAKASGAPAGTAGSFLAMVQ